MSRTLNNRLPWKELAAENAVLAGEIDASELAPRLGEALARKHPEGTVRYELHVAPGENGRILVTGRLDAQLDATCQRCLQPFRLPLEVEVAVAMADSPSANAFGGTAAGREVADLDEADAEGLGSLADLIEEELILAIPFLPRHELTECPAAGRPAGQQAPESESHHPFAGLREAMERSREDESD